MTEPMIPVLLALASAFLFGISSLTAKRGLAYVDAQSGSIIAIGTTVLISDHLISPVDVLLGEV